MENLYNMENVDEKIFTQALKYNIKSINHEYTKNYIVKFPSNKTKFYKITCYSLSENQEDGAKQAFEDSELEYSDFNPNANSSLIEEVTPRSIEYQRRMSIMEGLQEDRKSKIFLKNKNMFLHIPVPDSKEIIISETNSTFTITMIKENEFE